MRECKCGNEIRITGDKCPDCWIAGQSLGLSARIVDVPDFDLQPKLSAARTVRFLEVTNMVRLKAVAA